MLEYQGLFPEHSRQNEVVANNSWQAGKRQKRPRVRRGGIRGVQKLFGLQAIEELCEIYQTSQFLARLILRKM
jgi:hypothetical protein